MKAKIISEKAYEGMMDFIHGGGCEVIRFIVAEADNLVITFHDKQVYARTGFDLKSDGGDAKLLGEAEVPDELVEKALAFVRAKEEFNSLKDRFTALLSQLQQERQ